MNVPLAVRASFIFWNYSFLVRPTFFFSFLAANSTIFRLSIFSHSSPFRWHLLVNSEILSNSRFFLIAFSFSAFFSYSFDEAEGFHFRCWLYVLVVKVHASHPYTRISLSIVRKSTMLAFFGHLVIYKEKGKHFNMFALLFDSIAYCSFLYSFLLKTDFQVSETAAA